MKPKGTTVDVLAEDWLDIAQANGFTFAQLSYSLAIEHVDFARGLIAGSDEAGVTIWGRLPETPEDAARLVSQEIFYDAALAEFAEDPAELHQRFSQYEAAHERSKPMLRGVVVESLRGIAALPAMLDALELDLVLPGPFDLSKEMGLTPQHPDVQARVVEMIDICAARNVEVIASTTTHPGGASAAAASPATRLLYPGLRRAAEPAWAVLDREISGTAA